MDFRFLYHRAQEGALGRLRRCRPASWSRPATTCWRRKRASPVFIAIAKGDIPQEAWFHLGRAHTLVRGERVLLSWTGTMFEYLMPALWMRHYPGTIIEQSIRGRGRASSANTRAAKACRGAFPNRPAWAMERRVRLRAVRHSRHWP